MPGKNGHRVFIWSAESSFWSTKKGYGHKPRYLPYVIYACFILHNFCEHNNETINEDKVSAAIDYDREFQPPPQANNFRTDCNEVEGKRVRNMLTRFFDP